MPSFTLDEISKHSSADDCWIIVKGNVYDVTEFLNEHPGGAKVLKKVAGTDATKQFDQFHSAGVLEKYGPQLLKGNVGSAKAAAPASSHGNYEAVKKDIISILNKPEWDDGNLGPVLVRLAWHASGTYDMKSKTGGSQGATMRFKPESSDGANAGLEHARAFLEPIKSAHPWISYADLWTLAGVVAIEAINGPKVPWKGGRSDVSSQQAASQPQKVIPPNGRLPDAAQGASHVRDVFYRMGFNDQEIVALCGAHSLGRCHTDRSGFSGPWTHTPTRFSNQYYILLLNIQWKEKKWDGPKQYVDPDDELMMLPSDMALIWDPAMKKYVEVYAKDKDRFYKDFAAAFGKLLELGVSRQKM